MQISIEYCGTCNYRPRAAAMANAIREAFGVAPVLVHTDVVDTYRIVVDGKTIFSKKTNDPFPEKIKIIDMLKQRRGAGRESTAH